MTSAPVRRRTGVWLLGSAAGVAILALPDTGERVFSISATHGPSAIDLVGMVLVVGSWLPIAALLPAMWRTSRRARRPATVLAVVGAAALAVTIGGDLGWTWMVAVAMLVAAQAALIVEASRGQAS